MSDDSPRKAGQAEVRPTAPAVAPADVRPLEDLARDLNVSDFDVAGIRYASFGNATNAACTLEAFRAALASFRGTPCCAYQAAGQKGVR